MMRWKAREVECAAPGGGITATTLTTAQYGCPIPTAIASPPATSTPDHILHDREPDRRVVKCRTAHPRLTRQRLEQPGRRIGAARRSSQPDMVSGQANAAAITPTSRRGPHFIDRRRHLRADRVGEDEEERRRRKQADRRRQQQPGDDDQDQPERRAAAALPRWRPSSMPRAMLTSEAERGDAHRAQPHPVRLAPPVQRGHRPERGVGRPVDAAEREQARRAEPPSPAPPGSRPRSRGRERRFLHTGRAGFPACSPLC